MKKNTLIFLQYPTRIGQVKDCQKFEEYQDLDKLGQDL